MSSRLTFALLLVATGAVAQGPLSRLPSIEFVSIPPGEFVMGCLPTDPPYLPDTTYSPCHDNQKPPHRVRISKGFEMGRYEVTQAQWEAVMGTDPSYFKGPTRPVEQVSWNEVHEFLNRLNAGGDGYYYRLPTEAEWEYAARAGSSTQFPDSPRLVDMAWYGAGGNSLTTSTGQTHPAGEKQPNAWGLFDIRGNVAEWVEDWFGEDYYRKSPQDDPPGPDSGQYHLARGGSWYSNASYLRASNRYECACTARRDIGFRCVRIAMGEIK